jgi:hypothetical protein
VVAATEPCEAHELGDVDQPHGGVHHDGGQCGQRERRQQRAGEEQGQARAGDRDQARQLGATADGVGDGGAAAAAADREAVQHGRAEVRRAECEQLPLGVDLLAVPGGERAAREDVVGVPHERHAQGRAEQGHHVLQAYVGQAGRGQSRRDGADEPHPVVLEVEQPRGRGRPEHAEERDRRAGEGPCAEQHRGQGDQAEHQRRRLGLGDVSGGVRQLGQEAVALDRDAEQLAEL